MSKVNNLLGTDRLIKILSFVVPTSKSAKIKDTKTKKKSGKTKGGKGQENLEKVQRQGESGVTQNKGKVCEYKKNSKDTQEEVHWTSRSNPCIVSIKRKPAQKIIYYIY